jgi:CBS domain-containing protein
MRVEELLDEKGPGVQTISVELSVEDAIKHLTDKKISALIVMEGGHAVGIFTERDVLRAHVKYSGKAFDDIPMRDVMTNKLIVARPEDEISTTMCMMIQMDIRHLPVKREGKIIGMLSIRDLVHHQVNTLMAELRHLQQYIGDLHDANRD